MELRIDATKLKGKDLRRLEESNSTGEFFAWLTEFAGANLAELDELLLPEIRDLMQKVHSTIGDQLDPKKESAAS